MYQILEHRVNTVVIQNTETMEIIEITYDEINNYTIAT